MKKRSILPIIYAIGMAALLIVRDVGGIQLSKFIYFGYALAFMAPVAYETMVYMICFTLPLVCGLPGTYIMTCVLVLLILKRGKVNFWQLGLILFVAVWELIASFWYPQTNFSLMMQYLSFASVMLFLIHDDREVDYLRCVRLYLAGVCLLCGVIIAAGLKTAPDDWLTMFAKGHFRFGETQREETEGMSLILNANSMAYYSLTGITCGILCAEKGKGWRRVGYLAVIAFMIITGILTVSRSWLLFTAGCLLLYVFSKLRTPKQFIVVLLAVFVLVIAGSMWFNENPELLEGFTARLEDDNIETGGGRTDIFIDYMEYWASNPRITLMGTGVSQGNAVANIDNIMQNSMHNGTQQILVYCGLIGFVVYMAALIRPVLQARLGRKRTLTNWLPLLSVICFVQTIQFLNPNMLMLPFIIGIYALRLGGQNHEAIHHNRGHRGGQPVGLETR